MLSLERILQNDGDGWAYRQCAQLVRKHLRRHRLPSFIDVGDIVHDTWIQLRSQIEKPTFDPNKVAGLICVIALHTLYDHVRRQDLFHKYCSSLPHEFDASPETIELMLKDEEESQLQEAISCLEHEHRFVMYHHLFNSRPLREIAADLRVSLSTVQRLRNDALCLLQPQLDQRRKFKRPPHTPRKLMRLSLAAILKLKLGNRYLLVRNRHRPEFFGPLGGVFKYHPSAEGFLDDVKFTQQRKVDHSHDLSRDLRIFIPGHNFVRTITQFKSGWGREEDDCLRREVREELIEEVGLPREVSKLVDTLTYQLVHSVDEGPFPQIYDYDQFRYIEVYEPVANHENRMTTKRLFTLAKSRSDKLWLASRDEIERSLSKRGEAIASHAKYLFSTRWHGNEPRAIGA